MSDAGNLCVYHKEDKMRKVRKLETILLVLLVVVILTPTAALADEGTPAPFTPIHGGIKTFQKYLVMRADASVPNASFSYSITPGIAIQETTTTLKVLSGPVVKDSNGNIIAPTISDVTLTPDAESFGRVQKGDTLNLQAGDRYVREAIKVDLTGVSFTEPGVYRYIVTERGSNQGIHRISPARQTLDVYVQDQGDVLNVLGVLLFEGVGHKAPAPTMEVANAERSYGFTSEYRSYDLTILNGGNRFQGSRTKYFRYDVEVSGTVPGTRIGVSLEGADEIINANPNQATTAITTTVTQPKELITGENGTATGVFYLRKGQRIVLQGLAEGSDYHITETGESFTVSRRIGDGATAAGESVESTDGIREDTVIEYINTRVLDLVIGVVLLVALILLVAVAVTLLVRWLRRKNRQRRKKAGRRNRVR